MPAEDVDQIRKRQGEAVIIGTCGESYAATLKKIKEKVGELNLMKDIQSVRKSRKEKIILKIEPGGTSKEELLDALRECAEGKNVKMTNEARDMVTLMCKDIDSVTSQEELKSELGKLAGDGEDIEVSELRPAFRGTQKATIRTSKLGAERLMGLQRVRIGLNYISLRERVEVTKCYKCWGLGHTRFQCKGVDRGKSCLKCGEEGHKAKECKSVARCLLCRREGHRTGTGSCDAFRDYLTARARTSGDRTEGTSN